VIVKTKAMYINGFFKLNDFHTNSVAGIAIHPSWWSRQYEYPWAFKFVKENQIVADLGCGYTYRPFKNMLAIKCEKVYAVDSRQEALSLVIPEKNIELVLWDFTKPPPKKIPKHVDRIFCLSVLEEGVDIEKALVQFKKLIKPDGLIILTFDVIADPSKPVGKYQGVNMERFFRAVEKAELQIVGGLDFSLENRLVHPDWNLSPFHCVLAHRDIPIKVKHQQKTPQILEWIKKNRIKGSGIAAWQGHDAYPEVTGYLIPTLLSYGETKLVRKLADWLVSVQDKSGGFMGLDGRLYSFDTAAALEGLAVAGSYFFDRNYSDAAASAKKWISGNTLGSDGRIFSLSDRQEMCNYSLRVNGITGISPLWIYAQNPAWPLLPLADRSHYLSYAIEGLVALGMNGLAKEVLKNIDNAVSPAGFISYKINPNWFPVTANDVCYAATSQIGLLLTKLGIQSDLAEKLLDNLFAIIDKSGGVPARPGYTATSWTGKWLLDFENAVYDKKSTQVLDID